MLVGVPEIAGASRCRYFRFLSTVATRWKALLRDYNSPRKRNLGVSVAITWQTFATPTIRSMKCKQSPVYGVSDRYFHIPLAIVRKHELDLPFLPRPNVPIKFGTNSSTIFLVIVVTDRQT